MVKVHLQRAWYRPKQPAIHYVSNLRVLIRARPAKVRNPRTEGQQANRGKMAIASRFLAPLQDFVLHGFPSGVRPNGRPVGAYHMALGQLLNGGMRRENGQWRIDYARVKLAEGLPLQSCPLRVNRRGRTLRLAFHDASSGQMEGREVNAPRIGGEG